MNKFKKAATTFFAMASIAAASLATATPAAAAVPKLSSTIKLCSSFPHNGYGGTVYKSDRASKCAQVYTDITLNVRRGPGSGYAYAGYTLRAGQVYEFDCWAYGEWVDGDNIWLKVYTASGTSWVTDRYVYTGPNVTSIIGRC